jgi:hypothetical protein
MAPQYYLTRCSAPYYGQRTVNISLFLRVFYAALATGKNFDAPPVVLTAVLPCYYQKVILKPKKPGGNFFKDSKQCKY